MKRTSTRSYQSVTTLAAACAVALMSGASAQEAEKALVYDATDGISCATMAKDYTADEKDATANLHKAQIAAFLRGWISAMNMLDSSASTNVLNGHDPQGLAMALGLLCQEHPTATWAQLMAKMSMDIHQISPREHSGPVPSHTSSPEFTPL